MFLLFLYNIKLTTKTNNGGTINFIGLPFTINLTGLSSPKAVHIKPAININADIFDSIKRSEERRVGKEC